MRYERPNGVVQHYEGEKGTERLVRQLERLAPPVPSGDVLHYEGEKGVRVERLVRREQPSGVVLQTARAIEGRGATGAHGATQRRCVLLRRREGRGANGAPRARVGRGGALRGREGRGATGARRSTLWHLDFHGERGRERPNVTFVNLFVLAIVRFIVYVCRLQLLCQ